MEPKPAQPIWESAAMSSEAAAYYAKFLKRYRKKAQRVESTPLAVLIWGPGSTGGDLYEKRRQIRGVLLSKGDAAVFSEEIDAAAGDFGVTSKAREYLQAKESDFLVVLYGAPGSIGEVHDFAGFKEIASKMLIFVDSRHVGGYGYTGALKELSELYNNVCTYEYPKDIHECHLLGKVEERLRILRWAKWLMRQR
jgi:hypothetical protein